MHFIFLLLINSILAQDIAESTTESLIPEEKMAAIVQYTEGNPLRQIETDTKSDEQLKSKNITIEKQKLEFKDVIKYNDYITTPKNSLIKIITQKRCIAVLYENTRARAPKDKVSSWKIESGSVRWICPEEKTEIVEFKKSKIEINFGEVLISKNKLFTLRPKVTSKDKELVYEGSYLLKDDTWKFTKNQKDSYDLYQYEKDFPVPIESSRKNLTPPADPNVTRLYLAVAPIGWGGLHHHEKDNEFSDYGMTAHAFKIGANFPYKKKSILTFLEYGQSENKDSRNSNSGPQPVGYKSVRNEYVFLGAGLRHNHKNSSSYYYFGGLGFQRLELSYTPEEFVNFNANLKYFYNIGLGAGYQKIFWQKKSISLMVGTEFKVLQTLNQGKVERLNLPSDEKVDIKSMFTSATALVYLGPVFNF